MTSYNGSAPITWLIAGDVVAFLIFAALGRSAHGLTVDIGNLIVVAGPFLAAWVAVAALLGGYRPAAYARPGQAAARTALLWLVAAPVGFGLRAIMLSRGIPLTFAAITFTTVLIILVAWRTVFAALWRNRSR